MSRLVAVAEHAAVAQAGHRRGHLNRLSDHAVLFALSRGRRLLDRDQLVVDCRRSSADSSSILVLVLHQPVLLVHLVHAHVFVRVRVFGVVVLEVSMSWRGEETY